MPRLRQPGCDCPGALHFSDGTSGVDTPVTWSTGFTVPVGRTAELVVTVNAYSQKDQFNIYVDGGLVRSTGCIAGIDSYSATVSAGFHSVTVIVGPDCESF